MPCRLWPFTASSRQSQSTRFNMNLRQNSWLISRANVCEFGSSALTLCCIAAVILGPSCASPENPSQGTRPGAGIAEYRQIAVGAEKQVQAMLLTVAAVSAQSNLCSADVLTNYSAQVQRLQIDSVQVRARSQALQARGDAYFESWHENIARVDDRKLRALAETRRPLLQQSFTEIKRLSVQARASFDPFLAELRQVRNALEKDSSSVQAAHIQELLGHAAQNGERVEAALVGIIRELDSMQTMITPSPMLAQE
jgi:hypothetical protein